MKNIITPEVLATLKEGPLSMEKIVNFLDKNPEITTSNLSKLLEINPQSIYTYRSRINKKKGKDSTVKGVVVKNSSNAASRYSAEEKYNLAEAYSLCNDQEKSILLREYGIYSSDIQRWREQIKAAALERLGKRKTRSDKKSSEQLKIEELEKELHQQEKTTAKLSALIVLQKKTFEILKKKD